jgi:Zn-dependent protease
VAGTVKLVFVVMGISLSTTPFIQKKEKMDYSESVVWYVVFLFSTTVHEAAHAWSAHKMGDNTAYYEGQVSLNPIPHIKREPIGTVVVPIISYLVGGWMFGWASTPYNPNWAYEYPKKSAAMSVAGPISNFILIISSALAIHIGIWLGYFYSPDTVNISTIVSSYEPGLLTIIAKILSILYSLNLILFIFNLIPLPPLDGSGILPLYLADDKGRRYLEFVKNPAFSLIGIFIAWKIFDLIHWDFFLIFINLLYPGSYYK